MRDAAISEPADRRLQILRALAALFVLVDHSRLSLPGTGGVRVFNGFFGHLGVLGVALFFALSGYLMLATNRERFGAAGVPVVFFARRLLRIAPLYYLATGVAAFALLAEGRSFSWAQLAASALFAPVYGDIENPGFYPVLGVGWTLNLEIMFYAIFALALAFPRRAGIAIALGAILIGVALGRVIAAPSAEPSVIGFYAQTVVLLFACGVALAAFGRRRTAPPLSAAVVAALALLAALDTLKLPAGRVSLIAAAAAAPLLAVAVLGPATTPSRLGAALAAVGDASYSLYLFHTPVLIATNRIAAALALPVPLAFLFNVAAAGGLGLLAHPLLERPLRRRLEAPMRAWIEGAKPQFALLTLRR